MASRSVLIPFWAVGLDVCHPEPQIKEDTACSPCVAILMSKGGAYQWTYRRIGVFYGQTHSRPIRELSGACAWWSATSNFTFRPITLEFCKEALRRSIARQDKLVTIENQSEDGGRVLHN